MCRVDIDWPNSREQVVYLQSNLGAVENGHLMTPFESVKSKIIYVASEKDSNKRVSSPKILEVLLYMTTSYYC